MSLLVKTKSTLMSLPCKEFFNYFKFDIWSFKSFIRGLIILTVRLLFIIYFYLSKYFLLSLTIKIKLLKNEQKKKINNNSIILFVYFFFMFTKLNVWSTQWIYICFFNLCLLVVKLIHNEIYEKLVLTGDIIKTQSILSCSYKNIDIKYLF